MNESVIPSPKNSGETKMARRQRNLTSFFACAPDNDGEQRGHDEHHEKISLPLKRPRESLSEGQDGSSSDDIAANQTNATKGLEHHSQIRRLGECPICQKRFPMHTLFSHAEICTGRNERNSRFGECPMCQETLLIHTLPLHAAMCDGKDDSSKRKNESKTNGPKSTDFALDKCSDSKITDKGASQEFEPSTKPKALGHLVDHKREALIVEDCEINELGCPPVNGKSSEKNKECVMWWKKNSKTEISQSPASTLAFIHPTSEPIPGLFLYEDFITTEEEEQILAALDKTSETAPYDLPWKFAKFNGDHFGKRWGVHCNLRDRRVNAAENPLPPFITDLLLPKLLRVSSTKRSVPNEGNAIDYRRKQGHYLTNHVDDRQLSREPIANMSLVGDCYMTFRNEKQKTSSAPESHRVLLKRRTLQVLTGRARYDYSHGILNCDFLSDRRVSVTMRESPLTKKK
eukprot:scaffold63082_cov54-Attheya_sp.AAC.1